MRYGLSIILFFFTYYTGAQTGIDNIRTFGTKDGLSDNYINCILKDSRGYLWIGTSEGLNRFDGKHFFNFFNDDSTDHSLNGNTVNDILEFKPGLLLIATNKGLSVYNTFSNKFENEVITNPALKKSAGNFVRSLFRDNKNRILVQYAGQIDVHDNSLKLLYSLTDKPWAINLKGMQVGKGWFQDSKNRIWISAYNGIMIIDEAQQQVYDWKNNPMYYPFLGGGPVRSFLYEEKDSILWYSRWGYGLEKYNLKTGKHQKQLFDLPLANERRCINAISKQKDNTLLCAGSQAIFTVDQETLKYSVIKENMSAGTLQSLMAVYILKDNDYNWIGTQTKGIMQLPAKVSNIKQLPLPYEIKDYTNFCTGILRSGNGLLYLAYGLDGLIEVELKTFAAKQYKLPEPAIQVVYRICEDKKNRLWVGTNKGLYIFDKTKKKFSRPANLPSFVKNHGIRYLFNDSKDNLWVSFDFPYSLGYYSTSENKFYFFEKYVVNNKPIFKQGKLISRIVEDNKNNILMISYQTAGIACYETSTKKWKQYPLSQQNIKLLGEEGSTSITTEAENDFIWLSNVAGLGLAKFNYVTDSLSFVTRKQGLLSNNITAITKGYDNNLFLVTARGLNLYNTKTNEVKSVTLNDDNINWADTYMQFYDSLSNQLIFGINDRIIFIKNEIWKSDNSTLPTYIDGILVNNTNHFLNSKEEIVSLNHSQKNVSVSFSSNSYNENASISYAYKLDGIDKEWVESNTSNSANYTNLIPGNYTFRVKAKSSSGNWGPENSSFKFTIHPAFWQTSWFVICCLLFVGGITYWLVRQRIKTIRKDADLKQKLTETEMLALRSQMNPHFIFNCLSAIDNLIQTNQVDKATTYLSRFARLIRSVLESTKNNVVPFYKDYETLQIYLQLEQFRCNDKFSFEINADEELLQGDYKVPPLIVQPFVENAIHHGLLNKQKGEKILSVNAHLENNIIKYTITDNGVGRTRASEIKNNNRPEHKSLGIQITTERINLHNKKDISDGIIIRDRMAGGSHEGTEVEIKLKIV